MSLGRLCKSLTASTANAFVAGIQVNLAKFFGLNPFQQHVVFTHVRWKKKTPENYVVARCVMQSGACVFYSKLVRRCSRDVLATGQINVETQCAVLGLV